MPIKAKCNGCGTGFKAKDALAGKRVRCPKCKQPLTIPAAAGGGVTSEVKRSAAATAGTTRVNPMMGLLDEANVQGVTRGPTCENCAAELTAGAVLCIECGFNMETGKQVSRDIDERKSTAGMTDADRLMAQAEKDIDDMPVTGDGQDFGDGADSMVIAGVAGLILLLLVGAGVAIVMSMEQISKFTNPGAISMIAAIFMIIGCGSWITIVAFRASKPGHGIACVATGFLWAVVFGFMNGKDLLLPTLVLLFSFIIVAASGTYVSFNGLGPVGVDG